MNLFRLRACNYAKHKSKECALVVRNWLCQFLHPCIAPFTIERLGKVYLDDLEVSTATKLRRRRPFAAFLATISLLSVPAVCVLAPAAARAVSETDVINSLAGPENFFWLKRIAVDSKDRIYYTSGIDVGELMATGGVDVIFSFKLLEPEGLTISKDGNIYVTGNNQVWKVAPSGAVTAVTGFSVCGSGSGPCGVTDITISGDTLYIADFYGNRVRKVSPNGTITTVAGTGVAGFSGDGGLATAAQLNRPAGVAVAVDTLYISDAGNARIRKVSPKGIITTVVGTGTAGSTGDGGAPAAAEILAPAGLAFDRVGDLYIADAEANRVRKVTHMLSGRDLPPGPPTITTVAGTGQTSPSKDGGPAGAAALYLPLGVAVRHDGSLVISEAGGNSIRLVRNQPPLAMFIMDPPYSDPSSVQVPYTVTFDASGSTDSNDAIVLYQWDFGDGQRPTLGEKVSHIFKSEGLFNVRLTVTDASGATATAYAYVYTGGPIPYPGAHPCIPGLLPCP